MFFIEAGEGVVSLQAAHGEAVKLMAFGVGTILGEIILGEIAFYLGQRRTASAVATTEVSPYRLSRAHLTEFERKAPTLAAAFHYENRPGTG